MEEFLQQPDEYIYDTEAYSAHQFGQQLISPFLLPDNLEGISLAIIGIKEDRGSVQNVGSATSPDEIRKQLLQLAKFNTDLKIADLGNVEPGATLKDSQIALSNVIGELLRMKIVTVIIGGSHDLTYAQYGAYHDLNKNINVTVIDGTLDLREGDDEITDENFLVRIFAAEPSFLFNFNVVAFQTHLISPKMLETIDKMHFETYRLGKVRADIQDIEPVMRNTHLCSFDMNAIRFGDSPGNYNSSPNGLFGEEACQLARYAGQSEFLESFGLYGCNLAYDNRDQSVKLAAQIIWYFIDGFVNRKHDFPKEKDANYLKYTVQFKENKYEMNFWKSKISDRWWLEVPTASKPRNQKKFHIIPCSYNDYLMACKEEMPDRWLKAYQKLS
ncbi:MAG: formimidoylglutamase [Chitinophagales bacterium]|nr:formimidoylglutamase [Chitinophagales bacterium]